MGEIPLVFDLRGWVKATPLEKKVKSKSQCFLDKRSQLLAWRSVLLKFPSKLLQNVSIRPIEKDCAWE